MRRALGYVVLYFAVFLFAPPLLNLLLAEPPQGPNGEPAEPVTGRFVGEFLAPDGAKLVLLRIPTEEEQYDGPMTPAEYRRAYAEYMQDRPQKDLVDTYRKLNNSLSQHDFSQNEVFSYHVVYPTLTVENLALLTAQIEARGWELEVVKTTLGMQQLTVLNIRLPSEE